MLIRKMLRELQVLSHHYTGCIINILSNVFITWVQQSNW